jgi:hypothetical protein
VIVRIRKTRSRFSVLDISFVKFTCVFSFVAHISGPCNPNASLYSENKITPDTYVSRAIRKRFSNIREPEESPYIQKR